MKKNYEVLQTICGRAYILPQNPASRIPAVPTFPPPPTNRPATASRNKKLWEKSHFYWKFPPPSALILKYHR